VRRRGLRADVEALAASLGKNLLRSRGHAGALAKAGKPVETPTASCTRCPLPRCPVCRSSAALGPAPTRRRARTRRLDHGPVFEYRLDFPAVVEAAYAKACGSSSKSAQGTPARDDRRDSQWSRPPRPADHRGPSGCDLERPQAARAAHRRALPVDLGKLLPARRNAGRGTSPHNHDPRRSPVEAARRGETPPVPGFPPNFITNAETGAGRPRRWIPSAGAHSGDRIAGANADSALDATPPLAPRSHRYQLGPRRWRRCWRPRRGPSGGRRGAWAVPCASSRRHQTTIAAVQLQNELIRRLLGEIERRRSIRWPCRGR